MGGGTPKAEDREGTPSLQKPPLAQTPPGGTFAYNETEIPMSAHRNEKNATLDPKILQQLSEQAQAEGRTVDQLLDDAARKYLDIKRTITEMDSFVARNREEAIKNGWTERSISTVVKKHRQEKRGK